MDYDSTMIPIASAAVRVLLELDAKIAIPGEGVCAVVGL
jgi:hypothetical protein